MLREQLLTELKEVNSAEAAAIWAHRALPAKNALDVVDVGQLENAFQKRLAERTKSGLSLQEPPRIIRWLQSPPFACSHAEPSAGAPV